MEKCFMPTKFINDAAKRDCELLREQLLKYLKKDPVAVHVFAPRVGISIGALRSLLSNTRVMSYPQRVKLRAYFERIS